LFFQFNRQARIPLPCCRAGDCNRLDRSIHRSVQMDGDTSNLTQDQFVTIQSYSVAVLRIGQAVIRP
jgi:hypothetical protein